jgi:hypothetical protein
MPIADIDSTPLMRVNALASQVVSGNASNTDGASTACIAAQGAGIKTVLQMVIITNTAATATYVEIKDGTTVKLTVPAPATSGAIVTIPGPGLVGTANTAWNFEAGGATTTIYCSMVGYTTSAL